MVDGANLAIQDVRQSDEGGYNCVAKNAAGLRETETAFLKVNGKNLNKLLTQLTKLIAYVIPQLSRL